MSVKNFSALPSFAALVLCAGVWGQSPLPLFQPAAAPTAARPANPYALREGFVKVDWRAFSGAGSADQVSRILNLNLFADASFLAERTRLNWLGPNRFDWSGRIGQDNVVFSVRNGAMTGYVQSGWRSFEIEGSAAGTFKVTEVDTKALDDRERAAPDVEGEPVKFTDTPVSPGQPDPVIDVMVLYLKEASSKIPDIETYVSALFTLSNEAYVNSKIPQTIRLVHHQEVESGIVGRGNVAWLNSDPGVLELKKKYGADLTSMIVETHDAAGTTSGQSNICTRTAAFGNKTFPHELGHSMGAQHAWEQFTTHSGFAYGYIDHVNSWRTLMSYAECNMGGRCTRVNYFSNPDVMYTGFPTGIADSRDNARQMRSRSVQVSNNRPTVVPVNINERVIVDPPAPFSIRGLGRGRLDLHVTGGERLSIAFYSLGGKKLDVANRDFPAGDHQLTWKPDALAPGVHILQVRGRTAQKALKLTVMR